MLRNFLFVTSNSPYKLECLSLASLPKPSPKFPKKVAAYLSDAPFMGKLLGIPANIRLGWKGLPRTDTLAREVLLKGKSQYS